MPVWHVARAPPLGARSCLGRRRARRPPRATRARSCSPAPASRPTAASPTTAAPTAPAGSPRCSTASSSAPARPGSATGRARSSAGSASATPSRTPPTAPSPTSSAAARSGPVITQNVDGLHQAAGSRDVTELHGSLAEVVCLTCGDRSDRVLLQARMAEANPGFERLAGGEAPRRLAGQQPDPPRRRHRARRRPRRGFHLPRCTVCGGDALKPDVVFFGGSVPRERVDACYALTDAAPALLVARLFARRDVRAALRAARGQARHPGHGRHPRPDPRRRPDDPAGRRLTGPDPRRGAARRHRRRCRPHSQ